MSNANWGTCVQPLLHAVVFLVEIALAARLTVKFNAYYEEQPGSSNPQLGPRPLRHISIIQPPSSPSHHFVILTWRRTVMTMMVTNAILGGMADTVAQLLSAINATSTPSKLGLSKLDPLAIELHELDRKDGLLGADFAGAGAASPFDFERLVRFMAYGMGMAPVQFKWFRFLEWMFPITKASALVPALKRVLVDQICFSPCSEFDPWV